MQPAARAVIDRECGFAAILEILSLPTPQPLRLEHLGVLETVAGLGTNRICFGQLGRLYKREPPSTGSSEPRLREFVKMMETHPSTTVRIEGTRPRRSAV